MRLELELVVEAAKIHLARCDAGGDSLPGARLRVYSVLDG